MKGGNKQVELTKLKTFIKKDGNYTKEKIEQSNPDFLVVSIGKKPVVAPKGKVRTIYKVILKYKPTRKNYEKLLVEAIREKYSENDELAFLRQKDTKPEEFKAYTEYVEALKQEIKVALNYTEEEQND